MTNPSIVQPLRSGIQSHGLLRRGRRLRGIAGIAAPVFALALLMAACSGSSAASGGAGSIRITAPANGATVGRTFTVALDPSVPIGEPSTGRHHVHLYYDGNRSTNTADYDIAYTTSFTVTRLAPGPHTIEAVIANADHSVTDAHTQISVMVTDSNGGGAGGAPATTPSGGTGGY